MFVSGRIQAVEQLAAAINWCELVSPHTATTANPSLDRPIRRRTGTSVLSGGSCSGKTTMLSMLQSRGYAVHEEGIRDLLEELIRKGFSRGYAKQVFPEVVGVAATSHVIALERASRLNEAGRLVTDRGIGDYIGYLKLLKLLTFPPSRAVLKPLLADSDYSVLLKYTRNGLPLRHALDRQIRTLKKWGTILKYDTVFLLEAMPNFVEDGLRERNSLLRTILPRLIESAWKELGYAPRKVAPFFGQCEMRADFIEGFLGVKDNKAIHPIPSPSTAKQPHPEQSVLVS